MNKRDLSYINNIKDLQKEIRQVKLRIQHREQDIAERFRQLPAEAFKAAIGKVVPLFLKNKVASKSFQFGRILLNLLFNKVSGQQEKDKGKSKIMGAAKGLGLYAALKILFSILKKRKS